MTSLNKEADPNQHEPSLDMIYAEHSLSFLLTASVTGEQTSQAAKEAEEYEKAAIRKARKRSISKSVKTLRRSISGTFTSAGSSKGSGPATPTSADNTSPSAMKRHNSIFGTIMPVDKPIDNSPLQYRGKNNTTTTITAQDKDGNNTATSTPAAGLTISEQGEDEEDEDAEEGEVDDGNEQLPEDNNKESKEIEFRTPEKTIVDESNKPEVIVVIKKEEDEVPEIPVPRKTAPAVDQACCAPSSKRR